MDSISILQQALDDFCSQLLEDTSFVANAFKQIHQMKREFGNGYALINIGEFHPDKGEFTATARTPVTATARTPERIAPRIPAEPQND